MIMSMVYCLSGYFREMLTQWLKWAPPTHSQPTLDALEAVLQKSGHEGLAVKLRQKFLRRKVLTVCMIV